MFDLNDSFIWNVRIICGRIKKYLCILSVACSILSAIYLFYWALIKTDDTLIKDTVQYFSPLASLFFDDVSSIVTYKMMSGMLLLMSVLFYFACAINEEIKIKLINQHRFFKKKEFELHQQKIKIANTIKEKTISKDYSICLSLNYKTCKNISNKFKTALSNVVYDKLLMNFDNTINAKVYENTLIITSYDIENYDSIYNSLLDNLSVVKKLIKNKYDIELIPSLTTDACDLKNFDFSKIKNAHFEMKGCNFENRALSTAKFLKNYIKNKRKKYTGVPIGEYVYCDKGEMHSYELNVVIRNLSKVLDGNSA